MSAKFSEVVLENIFCFFFFVVGTLAEHSKNKDDFCNYVWQVRR